MNMKKIPLIFFILFALIMPFGALAAVEQAPGQMTYIPLEPLPCPSGPCDQSGTNFPAFVSTIFKVLIGFGGLFAVVMIVIAGIGYMLSESALDTSKAKARAQAALWGLLLLAVSWLILWTINPKLLEFNLTSINNLSKPSGTTNGGDTALYGGRQVTYNGSTMTEEEAHNRCSPKTLSCQKEYDKDVCYCQ